jgi:hypothetical protein
MTDILERLSAPFPPEVVSWRVGSTTKDKARGMALAYIDARDVQDRLNAVCGVYWQVRPTWSVNGKLACEIGVKIGDEWIWRGDGAGDTDVEADKGAFSDAFKRAAVRWGIGRYLYDIDSPWVELEQKGNTHVIKQSEMHKLRAVLAGKNAPTRIEQREPPAAKPQPKGKFETVDPNGTRLGLYDTPSDWCEAMRLLLTNFESQADGLWAVNKTTAEVIREHYPDIPKWSFKGKGEFHPVAVLARMVKEATEPKMELVP